MTVASNERVSQCSGIEYVKKYAKQMLKSALFTGIFQEKRYVEELNSYRDVVTVNPEETTFIQNLKAVKKKIDKECLIKSWVGITEPTVIGAPAGYSLWVVLQEDQALGTYWYKVKNVEFLDQEIRLKLEVVRAYQREGTPLRSTSSDENESFYEIIEEKKIHIKENTLYFFKNVLTFSNFIEVIKFLAILGGTFGAGLINLMTFLLDWLLKFIKVLSDFTKAASPIVISVINLVKHTIFGFYYLIYALFQSKPKPSPIYNNYVTFDPQNPSFARASLNRLNQPYLRSIKGPGPRITSIY